MNIYTSFATTIVLKGGAGFYQAFSLSGLELNWVFNPSVPFPLELSESLTGVNSVYFRTDNDNVYHMYFHKGKWFIRCSSVPNPQELNVEPLEVPAIITLGSHARYCVGGPEGGIRCSPVVREIVTVCVGEQPQQGNPPSDLVPTCIHEAFQVHPWDM